MTEEERLQIRILRSKGCSYQKIADIMGMKRSTVSSFCLRHNVGNPDITEANAAKDRTYKICPGCGNIFTIGKRDIKEYCSDKCRQDVWQSKRKQEEEVAQERREYMTLKKELDFLAKKSDECVSGAIRLCRTKI